MGMKKWISALGLTVILAVMAWFIIQPGVIKKIGSWKITKSDLNYRTQVAKAYFPDSTEDAALKQLEKSANYLKILEKNGVTVSEQDLDAEESRILKETKDPKQLEKIKQIFKDDKQAYRKNFLKPLLVDRFIYEDFFLNNPQVQKVSHEKAMGLIHASADKTKNFEELATQMGARVNTFKITKKGMEIVGSKIKTVPEEVRGKVIDESPKPNQAVYHLIQQEMKRNGSQPLVFWRDRILPRMKEGEALSQPISQDTRLMVVYLKEKKSAKEATVQIAIIEKMNFDQWVAEQEKEK